MPIIKTVGEGNSALHFVDGGPKCKAKKYGAGLIGWKCVAGQALYKSGNYGGECPACDGTGLIPVEQYSDEQLDAFLNTHFDTWDLRMRRELHTNEPVYSIEGEPWTLNFPCAETSRGAKIAAVIAVAEDAK